MKKLIWSFMVLLMIPIVFAPVEIQYSEDNTTWVNVTNVDETRTEAYQITLQEATTYYFRGRNSEGDYNYTQQKTRLSGETSMASVAGILFIMGIIGVLVLIILAIPNNRTGNFFRILLLDLIVLLFINSNLFMTEVSTEVYESSSILMPFENLHIVLTYTFYMMMIGTFIYLLVIGLLFWNDTLKRKRED